MIGGGIAGCSTAYFLAKRGVTVVLCEKGRIAGEQSSRNWGWVRKQGRDPKELPAIIESLRIWQGLETELQADLGWHQGGTLYATRSEKELAGFESWLEHAKLHQLDSRLLSPAETDALLQAEGGRWKGALFTPSDGRAEPAKAVPALARACAALGVEILTNCAVRCLETSNGRVSAVITERGAIACQSVVCAAGAWTGYFNRNLGLDLPQLKVKASVLRTKPAPPVTQSGVWCKDVAFRPRQDGGYSIAKGGTSSMEMVPDAFRYFRQFLPALRMNAGDIKFKLSGTFLEELRWPSRWGPEDVTPFERMRVLDPEPDHDLLRGALASAHELFPQLGALEIAETWGGIIETTPDAIPVLSAVPRPEGYYIATGFSGHGFGMGPGAGKLLSELILDGSASVDLAPFRFARFSDGSKLIPHDGM